MVGVLVILDGAPEPVGPGPTSLESARTPALDRPAAEGVPGRPATVPAGVPVGSETAIPSLLGRTAPGPVDRGLLGAAADEEDLATGERAWRVAAVPA